jgi:hypothetical protein
VHGEKCASFAKIFAFYSKVETAVQTTFTTPIVLLYGIKCLVFVIETESVYWAVRTEFWYRTSRCVLKYSNNTINYIRTQSNTIMCFYVFFFALLTIKAKNTLLCLYCLPLVLPFLCALLLTVVGLLCFELLSCVYLCYLMCVVLLCVLLPYTLWLPDCWLEVSIRKVLRPATSAQVFLGFPVSKSEC